MNEDILKDLLKKVAEAAAKKVVEETLKNRSHASNNQNSQPSIASNKGFTMFAPKVSLKAQQEQHSEELAETYKRNNHKGHELGKKPPKEMDADTRRAYDNYSAQRQKGKMLNEERQARLHKR